MRHALTALLAMAVVLSAIGPTLLAAPPEKAEAEKAPADNAEKSDNEFHLDFGDIKDLRDAEIELPDIKAPDEDPDLTVEEIVEQLRKQAEGDATGDEAEPGDEDDEPEINPVEVVKDIIDGMDDSAERLAQKVDPGTETQGVQKKVDDDLSKLIRYVKQKQQQQQQQQQGKGKQSESDSQRSKGGGRKQGKRPGQGRGKPKTSRAQQPAQDEQATKGQAQQAELDAVSKMAAERWGDLLKNAPRETLQAIPDMFLEKYRGLLGRYFYALAQQQAAAREDSE